MNSKSLWLPWMSLHPHWFLKGPETINQTNKTQITNQGHCKKTPHLWAQCLKTPYKTESRVHLASMPFFVLLKGSKHVWYYWKSCPLPCDAMRIKRIHTIHNFWRERKKYGYLQDCISMKKESLPLNETHHLESY